jgi:hypothetical protein
VNNNLTEAEKELSRWHFRLGHLSFRRIQFLMRSGALSASESARRLHTACARLINPPMCAACQFSKQKQRSAPGTTRTVVRDRVDALRQDQLLPGQRISIDHFICATRGRLFGGRGKTEETKMYKGGCIFVDSASGYVHVELQATLGTTETLQAKEAFKLMCRDAGVIPQEYLLDNGTNFTSKAFSENILKLDQKALFAGVGAHHHNGIAERHIQTIMAIARSMLIHSAVHWPAVADTQLWPMAVRHVFLFWKSLV